jgi:hypothetical protein
MRQDQIERLKDLAEKLADVVLEEADPAEWPGAGVPLAALTQEERGNRYWCKKNAAATFSLLERSQSLLSDVQDPHRNRTPGQENDLDKQIAEKERQASKVLEKAMAKARQAAHGRQA